MRSQGVRTVNENGELFCYCCAWRSPDGMTENQIDHVAINRRWKSSLQDHHLLVAETDMEMVWKITRYYGIPPTIVKMIQDDFQARVLHD